MNIPYDSRKNQENIRKHGISFEEVVQFDWATAVTKEDTRYDYGEQRFISYGLLEGRLHVLVWTVRKEAIRPISLRKANQRERTRYEETRS